MSRRPDPRLTYLKRQLDDARARIEMADLSKRLLVAALIRRYGADDGKGGKTLALDGPDLKPADPDESLEMVPGTKDKPGLVLRLFIDRLPETDPAKLLAATAGPSRDEAGAGLQGDGLRQDAPLDASSVDLGSPAVDVQHGLLGVNGPSEAAGAEEEKVVAGRVSDDESVVHAEATAPATENTAPESEAKA
jgi:hypothetical protein